MVLTYAEALGKYGSDYAIKKQISARALFKPEKGLYSTTPDSSDLACVAARFPEGVFAGESAFYFHALTDVIPDKYVIAIRRNATRSADNRVKYVFMSEKLFEIGLSTLTYNGQMLRIYDKERMLIELLRNKSKFPYDYYKEIVSRYRQEMNRLDIAKIYHYLDVFGYKNKYSAMLESEVL